MLQQTEPSAPRTVEVGKILAAMQSGFLCRHFRAAWKTAVLERLLAGGDMGCWTVEDGATLLDVLRSLRCYPVSAAEILIRDDPERAALLERGYESERGQYDDVPPFAAASIRRILELLTRHFPPGVALDEMMAAIEARLIEAMALCFTGKLEEFEKLERWDARSSLRWLRERIETFRRRLCSRPDVRVPIPPPSPVLARLLERLDAAERRAHEWPSGLLADKYLFQASTEYRTGRHDTVCYVASHEYAASAEEAKCLPANGERVRAFRLIPSCGLLTVADVHFHLQAADLKRGGFLPRLGVDYVLRVVGAKEVKALSSKPAVIERLRVCRVNMRVRSGAPYHCVSVRGLDPLDRLGIPRAVLRIDRGPSGPWVHVG